MLGTSYEKTGQYEKSHVYFARAMHLYEELGDSLGQVYVLHNIGHPSKSMGNYE